MLTADWIKITITGLWRGAKWLTALQGTKSVFPVKNKMWDCLIHSLHTVTPSPTKPSHVPMTSKGVGLVLPAQLFIFTGLFRAEPTVFTLSQYRVVFHCLCGQSIFSSQFTELQIGGYQGPGTRHNRGGFTLHGHDGGETQRKSGKSPWLSVSIHSTCILINPPR